jgi:hypothetical protein
MYPMPSIKEEILPNTILETIFILTLNKVRQGKQGWWYIAIIPALQRLRQEDH